MGRALIDTEHLRFEERPEGAILVRKRTSPPMEELLAEFEAALQAARDEHRDWGLIIDTRAVVGRNDAVYEDAVGEYRRAAARSFARLVVLVSSAVGELQAQRLGRGDGAGVFVTRDPEHALRVARGDEAAGRGPSLRVSDS